MRIRHDALLSNIAQDIDLPDSFSPECRDLLDGLLKRDVSERLGSSRGAGYAKRHASVQYIPCSSEELKTHAFFADVDWQTVYLRRMKPPLIPPRGEVNAADAFDIGNFDDDEVKGIKVLRVPEESISQALSCSSPRLIKTSTETST